MEVLQWVEQKRKENNNVRTEWDGLLPIFSAGSQPRNVVATGRALRVTPQIPGCSVDHRQPAKNMCVSYHETYTCVKRPNMVHTSIQQKM